MQQKYREYDPITAKEVKSFFEDLSRKRCYPEKAPKLSAPYQPGQQEKAESKPFLKEG